MTTGGLVRLVVALAGSVVVIGCLGEMWYGPRRGMTWAQFTRYSSWLIIVGTILVAQYDHRHLPITGYTIAVGIGVLIGSLGVAPALKRPMISKPPDPQVPDGKPTAP